MKPGPRGRRIAWRLGAALVLLGLSTADATADERARDPGAGTPSYRAVPLRGVGSLARLKRELGDSVFLHALKVNRVDFANAAARLDTLVVPGPGFTLLDLSPFPPSLPEVDSLPKLLLVSLRVQAFAVYEHGRQRRWGPISSGGRLSPTEPGLRAANWKDRDHVSSIDSTWIMPWTVNIDERVGTAFHQYSLPGRPASHCCIRLLAEDARWIYDWVDVRGIAHGTPVVLFGAYDFGARPPWKSLPADPHATTLGVEEMASALELLRQGGE